MPQQLGWLEKQSDVFNIAIQGGAVIAVLFNFTDRVKQLVFKWREPEARLRPSCWWRFHHRLRRGVDRHAWRTAEGGAGGVGAVDWRHPFVVVEKRLGDRQALSE